ncbi:MAG: MBOAT family protein, partial [Paludibacteraceae bacterium]|nr:MBOAT family protein [Paludibacteraceae bacterium]
MLLNSIPFLLFFLAVIIPYYTLLSRSRKAQNVWLLLASYVFYGMADWRMLPLLAATTLAFYGLGWQIARAEATNPMRASRLTTFGVVIGILVLFGFKYLGFCVEQFTALLARMGLHVQVLTLRIVMPLGISYFLFKLMSYLIEIHRQHIRPETDLVAFSAYV